MFDYIVVGGGSAGSVLAARLSQDPAVRVCLLEAGPADSSALIHCPAGLAVIAKYEMLGWNLQTTPQPGLLGRRGYQPRGKVLGGCSSVNAMVYIRGQREDYEHWAAEGNPGWGWDGVLPYFQRAEDNERGADAFHGEGGPLHVMDLPSPHPMSRCFVQAGMQAGFVHNPDFNGHSQEGVGLYQVTHKNGERHSAAKGYLTPYRGRPNLHIITGAQATRVLLDGRRAVGVEYVQDGGRQQAMAQREVLLCAGALLSPQLLMCSGIGPGAHLHDMGIAVAHDLPGVGQHLHDHPDLVLVMDAPHLTDLFGISLPGAWRIARGLYQWQRSRKGPLTTNFAEAGAFLKSASALVTPDLQLHFVIGKLVDHGRQTVLGHGYSVHVCLLQPHSRGSVRLSSADALQPPLIDPCFLADPQDLTRMVRGFDLTRKILRQPALAQYGATPAPGFAGAKTLDQIEQFVRRSTDTIYHPVGSCRMGPGPLDVVDHQLRVHGMQGLRVVDASIMPRIVSGNTNAPTIMIAEKAADMIVQGGNAALP